MRGGLTDSCSRLSTFGMQGALTRGGPYPHRSTPPLPVFHYRAEPLGNGIANINPLVSPGGVPVFTRATAAWTRAAAGDSWVSVGAGTARGYHAANGTFLGLVREVARTASGLGIRDITDAAWVSTVGAPTKAKDGTGIDGVVNSCSTITATGNGDTVLQTVVAALADKVFQPFIRRITGTGTVEITIDGGTSWTDITAQLSSTYHVGCEVAANIANPQYGFRLGTSGDKISVDMMELQNGLYATTPIGSAATRNGDQLNTGAGSFTAAGAHTIYTKSAAINRNPNGLAPIVAWDGTTSNRSSVSYNMSTGARILNCYRAGAATAALTINSQHTDLETPIQLCGRFDTDNFVFSADGIISAVDTEGALPIGMDRMSTFIAGAFGGGTLLELKVWNCPIDDNIIRKLTT